MMSQRLGQNKGFETFAFGLALFCGRKKEQKGARQTLFLAGSDACRILLSKWIFYLLYLSLSSRSSNIAITTIYPTMKIQAALLLSAIASSAAFAPIGSGGSAASSTQLRAEIGETGVAFENVAREWRCKVCAFDFHFLYVCACLDDVYCKER